MAGCGSDSSDRAGGEKPVEAKILTMANVNGKLGELEAFDEAVGRVSGGHLQHHADAVARASPRATTIERRQAITSDVWRPR